MPENKSASFNPSQKEAIEHVEGPMMVLAGPGSGKTFVITNRLYNMVQNEGINPENILVITFTRKVAKEMLRKQIKPKDKKIMSNSGSISIR